MLLVNQLCTLIQPLETLLVKSNCQVLVNLVKGGVRLQGRTYSVCKRWLSEALEFSEQDAHKDILLALENLLSTGPFDTINQDLRNLLGDKGLLRKHLNFEGGKCCETNCLAIYCIEALLLNKETSSASIPHEFMLIIKDIALNVISTLSYENQDKQFYNRIVSSCLRILRVVISDSTVSNGPDVIGEVLGVIQSFLFHGIKGYLPMQPRILRPAAMNLPEPVHAIPRERNFGTHKTKSRRPQSKKSNNNIEKSNSAFADCKAMRQSSDSDTSDTETFNAAQVEAKVRAETVHLLYTIVQNTPSREMFGYWSQIVANGSRNDARVLSKCILREPVSKIRQKALSTIIELLLGARLFLVHAEDVEHSSFITFFGTVGAMIRDLHFAISLLLSTEKNVAVLTQALKCAAALAQCTPYARLKTGLATKLTRNCRPQILHKDPTVRVQALSVFEALSSSDPITPEILSILAKQTRTGTDSEFPCTNISATSDIDTEEEVEFEVINYEDSEAEYNCSDVNLQDRKISSLLNICLKNVSNETANIPVRLQSLKLIGVLAFNVRNIVFSHLGVVATALVRSTRDADTQISLQACKVIETIAGCLGNSQIDNDTNLVPFWNIVFEPVISLIQHEQTSLREVACDCLGNIGSKMFAELSRQQSILVITILFGTVRDEESAVRAAALRALGMLVTLPTLEDDTGFLMDLADIVCTGLDDKNLGVRVKAAWTLANLCDCLVRQEDNKEVEQIPAETVLPKLYQASVKAAKDSDKVKCNAVRALGCILHLCPDSQILQDTTSGLDALISCATLGNDMKVRWNACRALGFVLSENPDRILPQSWRDQVFPALCNLICHSPNFKVRTNAAWALSVCDTYEKHTFTVWKSIILAFENSQHVPRYVEYPHQDALVQQLCLTFAHLILRTDMSEISNIWTEVGDHIEDIAIYMKPFQERILPEKSGDLMKAKMQLRKYAQSALNSVERQTASSLAELFERSDQYDNLSATSHLC
ncbi:HEAT repeat-containing protein 6 isoform X2 [Cephus cinctus]|nr:HEAT repeat-containing protein 6 isoform X2 [Cephus cinctus]